MANVNNPHGFRPLMRSISGGPGAAGLAAHKLAGDGTALFIYDAVKLAASGTKASKCVTAATAAAAAIGVNLIYGAASTATDHIIIPAMHQLFETQEDGVQHSAAYFAAADIDKNANIIVSTAGNANTKISGHMLGGASIATTSTLDLKIMNLFNSPDNAFGQYARIEVKFNNDQLSNQVAGV